MKQKFFLLSCFFLAITILSFGQGGRVLLLKDKGVGIRTFTAGSYIRFEFSNQQWITGYITRIENDSIDVNQFALQQVITGYGTLGEDTLKLGKLSLHKSEIRAFAKDKGQFNSVFTNGAFFKAAGLGYIGLNIANSLYRKDPVFENNNIPKLIGGGAAWIVGKMLQKQHPDYRPIGKRFSIEIL